MSYNFFTLSFTGNLAHIESAYKSFHFNESLFRIRIALVVSIFFYAVFGILDAIVVPELKYIFWTLRYGMFCPLAVIGLWYTYQPGFEKNAQASLFLLCLAAGIGIELMIILAKPPASYSYYAGIILVFITMFTFFRMRFLWATSCSWLIILFYEIGAFWWVDTPNIIFISNNFFFISANIFCMFAGYSIESNSRKRFLAKLQLEETKNELTKVNSELDKRVKEQTKELIKSNKDLKIAFKREKELVLKLEKEEEILQKNLHSLQKAEVIAQLGYFERNWKTGKGYLSQGLSKLLGYSKIVKPPNNDEFLDFIHPEDRADFIAQFQESVEKCKPFDMEFRIIQKNKEMIQIHGIIDNYYDNDGSLLTTGGIYQDITDRKSSENKLRALENRLVQSQKMESIGTLAGGIAHDFNNILSAILGYAQLAEMDIGSPDKSKLHLSQIIKSAQRASALIQQILTFSRSAENEKQPLMISISIKEAIKLLRASIPATIEIKENIFSKAKVMADPTQIHQVMMNLCTNSYHAMRNTGGVITINLQEIEISDQDSLPEINKLAGRYIKLEVNDTGHGIDKEIIEKIFDPYFTTKEIGDGTGLGLAMVQGIVKEHDGFMEVDTVLNKGTSFYVYFPIIEQTTASTNHVARELPLLEGDEIIMVVDDEELIRSVFKNFLERYGYQVYSFSNGLTALEEFKKKPKHFDLIITDMAMPKISGDKLVAKLLKIQPDLPIMLCTGYSEKISETVAMEMGVRKYVQKPISNIDLAILIREILDVETTEQ